MARLAKVRLASWSRSEKVRLQLLDTYGIGVIAAGPMDIRVAFSCLEIGEIGPRFEDLHKAIQDMR